MKVVGFSVEFEPQRSTLRGRHSAVAFCPALRPPAPKIASMSFESDIAKPHFCNTQLPNPPLCPQPVHVDEEAWRLRGKRVRQLRRKQTNESTKATKDQESHSNPSPLSTISSEVRSL